MAELYEPDVIYEDGKGVVPPGKISLEDSMAEAMAWYEESIRPQKEALVIRKKKAADELIALGVTRDSAYFLASYFEATEAGG